MEHLASLRRCLSVDGRRCSRVQSGLHHHLAESIRLSHYRLFFTTLNSQNHTVTWWSHCSLFSLIWCSLSWWQSHPSPTTPPVVLKSSCWVWTLSVKGSVTWGQVEHNDLHVFWLHCCTVAQQDVRNLEHLLFNMCCSNYVRAVYHLPDSLLTPESMHPFYLNFSVCTCSTFYL